MSCQSVLTVKSIMTINVWISALLSQTWKQFIMINFSLNCIKNVIATNFDMRSMSIINYLTTFLLALILLYYHEAYNINYFNLFGIFRCVHFPFVS